MRENQKGFTLIELILVVAIIGIMATALGAFITSGSSSFRATSRNTEVQMKLQETMNQLQDLVMDTNYCINVTDNWGPDSRGTDI